MKTLTAALALALMGCGTFNAYRLPMDSQSAPSTYAPLVYAAQQRGLVAFEGVSGVVVKVDPVTQLWFRVNAGNAFEMVVRVTDDQIAPGDLSSHVQQTRALGDALWNEALAARRATAAPVIVIN